jgi:transposase InsO family protein
MCKLLNVSRSGYHSWVKRPESRRSQENRALEAKIRVLHATSHGIYGAPKIHRDLVDDGIRCGKNRVARIMRKAGIRSRTKKKFKATTNSKHNFPVAPNLLNQKFEVAAADHTWVGDITYIHTNEGWLYLAVLLDLFNREVVGWSTCSRLTRQLAVDALQMALGRRNPGNNLIHHSDQGSQYASTDYQKILKEHEITCSMSRKGNCYDNAVAESFFGRMKSEWINHYRYLTRSEATQSIFYYIEIFYNRKRL